MENNGLPGGIFSGIKSGMLGLELPVHHHRPQQQQPQPQQNHLQNPQNSHNFHHFSDQSHQSIKHSYPYPSSATEKPKPQSPLSDEDEPGFYGDGSTTSDGKRKAAFSSSSMSPWQRMKWTDDMVRLLIMAVFYIGDEAGSDPSSTNDPTGKKKVGALSQKKGKWKSVSAAMMEKGFYVSPQQCEDKFNDLNKRYKRVNDILGKGTACKVVENQNLLESMELSSKMKEEVKKLLNSKHLFFREMCAYHNSCGHGGLPINVDQSLNQNQNQNPQPENPQFLPNSLVEVPKTAKRVPIDELEEEEEEEEQEDEEDDESDEDGDHDVDEDEHEDDDDDHHHGEKPDRKRRKTTATTSTQVFSLSSAVMQQLNSELMGVIQDGSKSSWEKKHWMKVRLMQLEEQQVGFEYQAFKLEKQRLKWVKFSSKKERDMERSKLENERRRLENERMVLLIRQKELELLDLQQNHYHQQQQFSSNKRGDPSSVTG